MLWISVYFAVVLFVILTYKKKERVVLENDQNRSGYSEDRRDKLVLVLLAVYALLFAVVNLICTRTSVSYGSDRENYLTEFRGQRKTSVGLEIVFNVFRFTSDNFEHVLLFTTFFSLLIILFAHKIFENSSNVSLAFLLTTDLVFFTFTALKQSFACAFVALFFVFLFKKRTVCRGIVCFLLLVLAIVFHTSSVVLIPIFIVCYFKKINKTVMVVYMILLVLLFVFFVDIGTILSTITRPIFPRLSELLTRHFSSVGGDESSTIAFLKGIPFYLLLAFGFFYRRRLQGSYPNYDKYLIVLATASMLYMCSIYIYWTLRFRAFFYLPAAIFFGTIYTNLSKKEKVVFLVSVIGSNLFLLIRWVLLIYTKYGGF